MFVVTTDVELTITPLESCAQVLGRYCANLSVYFRYSFKI
jgi:hypothetical protein